MGRNAVQRMVCHGLRGLQLGGTGLLGIVILSGCGNGSGSQRLPSAASVSSAATTVSTAGTTNSVTPTGKSSACTLTTYSPNFATENDPATGLPNQLYHWNRLPISVYFAPSDYLTSDRKAQALAGFGWWSASFGQSPAYNEVASASAATVIVQFQPDGPTNYGAITNYHFDTSHLLVDAIITFNMTYLATIGDITPVAAHEFGHALGIGGHSNDTRDVMSSSAQVYYLTNLDTRDVNTLLTAYCGLPVAASGANSNTGAITKSAISASTKIECHFGIPTH